MITVLGPNMGSNALGRALVLAQLVDRLGYPVRIVGSLRKSQPIWAPALETEPRIPMETFPLSHQLHYPQAALTLKRMLGPNEIVIISKSLPTSMGLALMAGVSPQRTILDIDDWEMGFRLERYQGHGLKRVARLAEGAANAMMPWKVDSDLGVWCAETVAPLYPHRTVSNQFLAERFGGRVVRHARDEREMDPAKHDGRKLRADLQIPNDGRVWVGFIGTPRKHKGVDVLVDAMARLRGQMAPGLLLFGFDENQEEAAVVVRQARALLGEERLRTRGFFPMTELADHVAAADIIAIPSLENEASRGQIPAKLFDAMAMGRSVVVSNVNDMADILGDAGEVVPAANPAALSAVIEALSNDAPRRRELGQRARQRFLERDSFMACAQQLDDVLQPLLRHTKIG